MKKSCWFPPNIRVRLMEALLAMIDEVSQTDPRAKIVQPQDLVDRRYIDDMEKTGFFTKLWADKR